MGEQSKRNSIVNKGPEGASIPLNKNMEAKKMYNHQITKLIQKNLELDRFVASLLKDFNETSDIASLERIEEVQEEMTNNSREIARLRGDN